MAVIDVEVMKHWLELLVASGETLLYVTICSCGWQSPHRSIHEVRDLGREHLVEMVGLRFHAFWLLKADDRGRLLRRGNPNYAMWFPYKNRVDGTA